MKVPMLLMLAVLSAAAPEPGPLKRFSYSGDLAGRMNKVYGVEQLIFVTDEARGRKLAAPRLLGAIQRSFVYFLAVAIGNCNSPMPTARTTA